MERTILSPTRRTAGRRARGLIYTGVTLAEYYRGMGNVMMATS